jgi:hypothetical protein
LLRQQLPLRQVIQPPNFALDLQEKRVDRDPSRAVDFVLLCNKPLVDRCFNIHEGRALRRSKHRSAHAVIRSERIVDCFQRPFAPRMERTEIGLRLEFSGCPYHRVPTLPQTLDAGPIRCADFFAVMMGLGGQHLQALAVDEALQFGIRRRRRHKPAESKFGAIDYTTDTVG